MHLTDTPNPEVPVLQPFTLRDRYETVVEYWLLGYGADWIIAAVAAGLLIALLISYRWRSSVGLLVVADGRAGLCGGGCVGAGDRARSGWPACIGSVPIWSSRCFRYL